VARKALAPKRTRRREPAAEGGDGGKPASGRTLASFLGHAIRELRTRQTLTNAEVAGQAEISRSLLSKIENGQVATSLDTLSRIASVLGVSLGQLFREYDAPEGSAQLVKADAAMEVVRRGTRRGHTYHLLAYDRGPRKLFEPFLISMDDASEVFPRFEHPGTEFIYVLRGKLEYRHGRQTYLLEPGDSLTFRGDVPHGPERLVQLPIQFITVLIYAGANADA